MVSNTRKITTMRLDPQVWKVSQDKQTVIYIQSLLA